MRDITRAALLISVLALALVGCMAAAPAAPPPAAEMEFAESAAPAQPASGEALPPLSEAQADAAAVQLAEPGGQMIIKNGQLDLQVQDVDAAVEQVTQVALSHGGYVLSTDTQTVDDRKRATVVITVAVDQFESAMAGLRDIGDKVLRESASGEDVTSEYVDLQAQQRNLEATIERVRGFLDEAQTVEDALAVNQELSRLESELEQVKGRIKYLEGRSAQSTITVNLQTEPEIAAVGPWTPGRTVQQAARTSGHVLRFLFDATIFIVIVLVPPLLILAVLVWIMAAVIRRLRRRRPRPAPQSPPDTSA
jgi:Na+-transporting methylmalonyl-CoA/oxaloacetate decarboxylase gamma subunit